MSFAFANPKQLWIEISPVTQTTAQQAAQAFLAPGAKHQVYLNQLCLQAALTWAHSEISPTVTAFPLPTANPASWEIVTGTRLSLETATLAIIPSDTVGKDELRIPQEWVDIPNWCTAYYLAAKFSHDHHWMEIWGFASHRQVKTEGEYDAWDRSYSVAATDLATDISALWTTLERNPLEQDLVITAPAVSSENTVTALSDRQAERLIGQLAHADQAFPRLSIPFAQWGALLANEHWRTQLLTQRLAALQTADLTAANEVSLSQWLQKMEGTISLGWQSLETVFGRQAQQMAFGFRQATSEMEGRQAKVIRIGPASAQQTVRLVILWHSEADGRLVVRVQMYPAEGEQYLPIDIRIALLSDQNERLQTVHAEAENNYIQLKRFRCPSNYAFQIEIQLGQQVVVEQFVA